METTVDTQKSGGILGWIERAGNKLPDPVLLFLYFIGIIIVISVLGSVLSWQAVHPVSGDTIVAVNLLSRAGIVKMFTEFSNNIRSFGPLIDNLVVMLGLSLLEGSGLAEALLRRFFVKMPPKGLTLALAFVAVSSSVASDAGFMLLPPLAALIFLATGRNPLVGIIAAYGSVAAGFAASYFIGIVEVVGLGFAQSSAQIIDPNIIIPVTSNYFFTLACSTILPVISFLVVIKIVEPRLGAYTPDPDLNLDVDSIKAGTQLSDQENRGLRAALIAVLVYLAVICLLVLPPNAILRNPDNGGIISSPFMSSIILTVTGVFFFPGIIYGFVSKNFKTHRDVVAAMVKTYSSLAGYILVAILAGQLIQYFSWSNLGIIFAINGAEFLKSTGVPVIVMLLLTILFVMLLNFLVPSHAGKLGLVAPILVPLFMMLGVSPEATYLCYRIGDSITNAITPLFPYFVLMVSFARKYKKDVGIGTLMSNLIPFSAWYCVGFVGLFLIFYIFKIPLGPGASFTYVMQ